MKLITLLVGLLAIFMPLVAGWSKEDREIFRVRDELAAYEGYNVTFYDYLGVKASASQEELSKAYRTKTKSLHPDKVKQRLQAERLKASKDSDKKKGSSVAKPLSSSEVKAAIKKAGDQQARLSIVANILRGPERARYDHFIKNGFPVWKGTEYYYARYRPGAGTVMVGIFVVVGGGVHYLALYLSWKRQREFVERYIKFARHAAWGDNLGIPGLDSAPGSGAQTPQQQMVEDEDGNAVPMNRKIRRMQERENKKEAASGARRGAKGRRPVSQVRTSETPSGPQGAKKRVVAENGKVLVVDSVGDVYLEQEDADGKVEEFLLDPQELAHPTFRDTAVFRLPAFILRITVGKLLPQKTSPGETEATESTEDKSAVPAASTSSSSSGAHQRTPSTGSAGDDFELLEKSLDELGQAKSTGTQGGGKTNKRKGRKK
ncbi:uncharacterized protein MKZ38_002980 [Zalerion maritima]|uniref:J domain-containing protein n=1 Tax=Zalerion maritima TaxID=339359 RepID=A0AAD5RN65_9PEZI|nr:uncharacterized protein MKZ38_002980 [Zalerion maritima]